VSISVAVVVVVSQLVVVGRNDESRLHSRLDERHFDDGTENYDSIGCAG
jgi:hypothetical protein